MIDTTQDIGNDLAEKVAFCCNSLQIAGKDPKVTYQEVSNRVKLECDNQKCFLLFSDWNNWDDTISKFIGRLSNGYQ